MRRQGDFAQANWYPRLSSSVVRCSLVRMVVRQGRLLCLPLRLRLFQGFHSAIVMPLFHVGGGRSGKASGSSPSAAHRVLNHARTSNHPSLS